MGYGLAYKNRRVMPFLEARPTLDAIKQIVTLCPSSVDRDLDSDLVTRYVVKMETYILEDTHLVFQRSFFMLQCHTKREKRKREDMEEKFKLLADSVVEESRARKILEQKCALHFSLISEFENTDQARCSTSSISLGEEAQVLPLSSDCFLKNFRKGVVAHGYVRRDTKPCKDSYMVRTEDIFEPTTQLYEGEGTLGDTTIGSSVSWPQYFVKMIW